MKKKTQEEKGITLIALVITVIVLLILAAAAINLTIDSNGIFAKASQGAIAQDRGVILEKLRLELLWSSTGEVEFLQLLKNNNWADDDAVLNIQNLIGKKLTTGNGSKGESGYEDVYTVALKDNAYKLIYYDEEGQDIEVGTIGTNGNEPDYT